MKALILAAGEGVRLRPYTLDRPKCLVEFLRKPIINYIYDTLKVCKLEDIIIVDGYKGDRLRDHFSGEKVKFYANENFDKSNMVTSLFCTSHELDDDIIISYSDIIYNSKVLSKLIENKSDISVVVDRGWLRLWNLRMENPLNDAETMKINSDNNIIELGKKPKDLSEIQGQYIGLIKFSKKIIKDIVKFYNGLDRDAIYEGKSFNNMFMTSFLQLIIDRLMPVNAVFIDRGWIEIDSVEDLKIYSQLPLEKLELGL